MPPPPPGFLIFCLPFWFVKKTTSRRHNHVQSSCCKILSVVFVFTLLLISQVQSLNLIINNNNTKQSYRSVGELKKLKYVRAYLNKINKPALKTIQTRYGDIIDCVPIHLQPAFDHPLLKGKKPIMEPIELPEGDTHTEILEQEYSQFWGMSDEYACPENTVPIRRTTEEDVLRAKSVKTFGRKIVRKDGVGSPNHEHALGYVNGDTYYGAKAVINVWAPKIEDESREFSLSQIWVIAGSFDIKGDLNTIEAGWQVSKNLYNDTLPRLFIYWTDDAYGQTGCYNLECSGFVQISRKFFIGHPIKPISSYNGDQFDIPFLVWKDPKSGNWGLHVNGEYVGYWPKKLFKHLSDGANMVQFGGEIVNSASSRHHTSTQMGSGHFPAESYKKASYFRNLQVVNKDNHLIDATNLRLTIAKPNCYDIKSGRNTSSIWGSYFFYGGPGRNSKCP